MLSSILKVQRYKILLILASLTIVFTIIGVSVVPAQAGNLQWRWFSGYQSSGPVLGALPAVNGGIPGLSGFRFNFKSGDHHFRSLVATFDSPGVVGCCSGLWYENLSDYNNDDAYWYDIRWQELPSDVIYGSNGATIPMDGATHSIYLGENNLRTSKPVLTGFKIAGSNGDSHLEGIQLHVDGQSNTFPTQVYVTVQLNGGGSEKSVFVSYALVPLRHIARSNWVGGTSSGSERSGTLPDNAGNPVLTGFKLKFTNGAHHIDRLGVEVWPNSWRATFEDHNHDDPYEYGMTYVDLLD